jgi:DNA ligase-1
MKQILKNVEKLIQDVNSTNSSNEKMKLLANYPDCKKILNYIYDDFKMFHLTSSNIKKQDKIEHKCDYEDLYELLDALVDGTLSGHEAIAQVRGFIVLNIEYKDIIYKIIDKDLKIGMGVSNINKVFKGLIPTFDVALANSYDKVKNIDITEYYGSHKLDGLRCINIKQGKNINFYSRKGKEFLTLDVLKKDIAKLEGDFVLDGEICIVDENGKEDFTSIMKLYKKKDFTIPNPRYKVFDMLTIEEFQSKTSKRILSERIESLKKVFENNNRPTIDVLEQVKLDEQTFADMRKKASDNGWEGLILRKDCEYKGKRSNDLLKVKKFFDAEFIVEGIETGPFQVVENGDRKEIDTLTAVNIKYKGYDVKVGSGFSLDERKKFFKNPKEIIGKQICVQYFEESKNENGGLSLRFPTVKYIYRDGKREV